ncbi:hypothetical protein PsorP6_006361 [Peronosclerospora sorghi]|uniref:Uncharacterized protein n=1 Tax=Peronosclerospora sorghi TaxID=230839 RepID=A0ACC0W2X5_9STRA|nr:hypothetical protein PsorP6_006361 [Peronosclerospora sorghi]
METSDAVPSSPPSQEVEDTMPDDDGDKVIVMNYGKWKDAKVLHDVLSAKGITFLRVQKARQLSFGFVHFHSKEEREQALPKMKTIEWNGELLEVKDARPKRHGKPAHKSTADPSEAPVPVAARDVRDVVTPWATVPYQEQLERKETEMKKVLVKIVRLSRKEYGKKEKKRVARDTTATKKRKVESEKPDPETIETLDVYTDDAKPQYECTVPAWLQSNGSLYVVANHCLYARPHEGGAETPWTLVADAADVVAIISFGSDLVGVKTDNGIYALKADSTGKEGMCWAKIGHGPEQASITSLASLRGTLLSCTSDGKIYQLEGSGSVASSRWKQVGEVPGATIIGLHNGFLYVHTRELDDHMSWSRAPVQATALETLAFEPCDLTIPACFGLTSHNALRILLTSDALVFVQDNGSVKAKVPLPAELKTTSVMGLASHRGLCCPLDAIRGSPVTEGYRNKCEFNFGFDSAGKPCVGFRLGLFREGSVVVSKPDACVNVSMEMKAVCAVMQTILETSDIPVYNVTTKRGVWRVLTVRQSFCTGELMVMVQVNLTDRTQQERDAMQTLLVHRFTNDDTSFNVTSLYIQEYDGFSAPSENDPVEHVFGKRTLEEELLGMRFSVSPTAFFQVNTRGAETLYALVKEFASADEHTLVYDVCCGTGTIGICVSKGAGRVVGIEMCKSATEDAEVNARLNGIKNVSCINSKAENVMKDLLQTKREERDKHLKRVVAIVDPPRAGLHHQVLRALRACPPVERIVYISCNPSVSLVRDAVTLCGPSSKSIQGEPFQPTRAAPVDMFPHTPHCEMILVFDRVRR